MSDLLELAKQRRARNQSILDMAAARRKPQQNADGTYGEPPADMFANPVTGQMTSREMLRENANVSPRMAAVTGGMQGTGFGYGDEVLGGVGYIQGGPDMANFRREQARATIEANQESHPYISGGSEIGGAILSALPYAALGTGKSLLGTMARGFGIGAAEGALHGSGRGEGAADRGKKAIADAILGAGVGVVAPAAVSGVKAIYRGLSDPILGAFNADNSGRARRAIAATLEKSGKSVDDLANDVARAAREGQPEYRTVDALGITGQRRASGLARAGGEPGDSMAEYLTQRQIDQADRVSGFIDDAFDMGGASADNTKAALTKSRDDAADIAYDAARGNAAPVDVRNAVAAIDARIGGMKGVDIKGDGIDAKLYGFRNRLAAQKTPEGVDSIELSDFDRVLGVKQDVQDAIGAAERAGRNNEARELRKLVASLDEALEASSDMYRAANDGFRDASRVIDAIDSGRNMAAPARRAADTTAEFARMTPEQQASARVGYGDKSLAKLESNTSPTSNKAKPFQSTKAMTEAEAMATDPRLFKDRMARESAMWETQNRALGGSRTADNLSDIDGAESLAADVGGVLRSTANFQMGDAIANMASMIAPKLTGQNEATRRLMVEALLSADPRAALGPAARGRASEILRQRMVEALLRNAGREVSPY